MKHITVVAAFTLAALAQAHAADDIIIGALYPLTGNAEHVSLDAKAACEVAANIVARAHTPIPMLMGHGGGLDRLGGAKTKLVCADSQNNSQKARAETEWLFTQDRAAAITGSTTSATAATISQVTERYEMPCLSADNSSPSLNQRGLTWFFRTCPHDEMFSTASFQFYKEIDENSGHKVKSVTLLYGDSIFDANSGVRRTYLGL